MTRRAGAVGLAVALATATVSAPRADPARGERVFQRCYACHSVAPDEMVRLQGPTLRGIVGRPAAIVVGYDYSDAMKAKAAAGLVWTPQTLDRFIADPDAFVPGTPRAILPPLSEVQDRADLIAYLARAAGK